MTRAERSKAEALAAFPTKKEEIDTMLVWLQALSDDHFDAAPEATTLAMWATSPATPQQGRDGDHGNNSEEPRP